MIERFSVSGTPSPSWRVTLALGGVRSRPRPKTARGRRASRLRAPRSRKPGSSSSRPRLLSDADRVAGLEEALKITSRPWIAERRAREPPRASLR